MIKQSLILIVFISILSNLAGAQDNSLCIRPEVKMFLPLIGIWKVNWTSRVEPGKYETVPGTSRIERELAGCALVEHFSSDNKKFSDLSPITFGNKDELQRVYMDSGHGRFLTFKGVQEREIVRFEWEKNLGERILMLKHESQKIQPNSFDTTTWLSTDSGKTWNIVRKSSYERQAKK